MGTYYGNRIQGFGGLSSVRLSMFPQTNVCESYSRPTGRPLLELALRLLDCQPDSFTTEAAATVTPERPAAGSSLVCVLASSKVA